MNALTPVGTPGGPPPAATDVSQAGVSRAGLSQVGVSQAGVSQAGGRAALPELRELRYFAAAARAGNLARAAQEMNVSAAAISQQLRKLEDTLGTPLLIRHGRGVAATAAGMRLLDRIDTVLRLLAAPLEHAAAGTGAAADGTISLAMPAELGGLLAGTVAALVRDRWPELTLDLHDAPDSAVEGLCAGLVDIALLADPPAMDTLVVEQVASERLGVVVSPRDALADSADALRLRDLLAVPLILPGKRHWIRRRLAKAAFQRGLRFDAVMQVDSLPMARAMVRDGLGCTILPHAAVQEDTARGALVFRPLEQPDLPVAYAIVTPGDAHPVLGEIARAAGAAIRALAGTARWPGARPLRGPAAAMPDLAASGGSRRRPAPAEAQLEFAEGN